MKKIFLWILVFLIYSFKISFAETLEFEKDKEYLSKKNFLFEEFKKIRTEEDKKDFIENCLNFWKYFFWESLKKDACYLQISYISLKLEKNSFLKNIEILEKNFYKKFRTRFLEIQFWWDIMLSRTVWYLNKKNWYDRILKDFNPNKNISKDTILFYNLESPFSEEDNDKNISTFIFKANPKNIEVLNELKWENQMIISLANNHITNAWWKGIDLSLEILEKNNIISLWVWRKEESFKFLIQNWVKVCFWAYTYDWQIFHSKDKNWVIQKYFINKINREKIFSDLEKMKIENCDFKVISLHWWAEYRENPTKQQENLAYFLIDSWADLILGWHSHIPGKIEKYNWKMIYYSLWNFIFDQDWWKTTIESWVDYKYDEKLKKNTVPTYIWNTFYNKYKIIWDKIELIDSYNIKHRINYWKLEEY